MSKLRRGFFFLFVLFLANQARSFLACTPLQQRRALGVGGRVVCVSPRRAREAKKPVFCKLFLAFIVWGLDMKSPILDLGVLERGPPIDRSYFSITQTIARPVLAEQRTATPSTGKARNQAPHRGEGLGVAYGSPLLCAWWRRERGKGEKKGKFQVDLCPAGKRDTSSSCRSGAGGRDLGGRRRGAIMTSPRGGVLHELSIIDPRRHVERTPRSVPIDIPPSKTPPSTDLHRRRSRLLEVSVRQASTAGLRCVFCCCRCCPLRIEAEK